MIEHKIIILAAEGRIPDEETLLKRLTEEGFMFRVLRNMDDLLEELSSPPKGPEYLFAEYVTFCRDNPCADECCASLAQCYKDCERCKCASGDFVMFFLANREDVGWLFNPYKGWSAFPSGYFPASSHEQLLSAARDCLAFCTVFSDDAVPSHGGSARTL